MSKHVYSYMAEEFEGMVDNMQVPLLLICGEGCFWLLLGAIQLMKDIQSVASAKNQIVHGMPITLT